MVSAHLGGGQHPTVGCCPRGGWVGCAWLAHLTHPPGGIPAHLVGGWGALGLRISPTHQVGNTPQWGVAHPPGGQRPITLEYQIYLPAIDTIVTGMGKITIGLSALENNSFFSNYETRKTSFICPVKCLPLFSSQSNNFQIGCF